MLQLLLLLLALAAPTALVVVALIARRQRGRGPSGVLRAARVASSLAVLGAASAVAHVVAYGSVTTPLAGTYGLGFAVRLDPLSVTMLALVAFMGAVVLRFSRNYLDGDARHGAFVGDLALTIASVMLLVVAGTLLHLAVFWALTSFSLHRLLLFYRHRRGAQLAARKKFVVARAGDVLLAAAGVLLWLAYGTGDIAAIAEATRVGGAPGSGTGGAMVGAAAFMIAGAAALKSAVFPTHGWLLDVMETPTPVSALLHAGIINGGTFLLARLADVMLTTPVAMHLLVLVGASTAVLASCVLVTQPSVKTALAWSSAAHMGFMLMLCGVGAFPVAILHLVAHSFYKAHAFLSSGSAVEVPRTVAGKPEVPGWGAIVLGLAVAGGTVVSVAAALGADVGEKPVTLGLAAVIAIALTQLWAVGLSAGRGLGFVLARVAVWSTLTTLAFVSLELAAADLLAGSVPVEPLSDPVTLGLLAAVIATFALVVAVQLRLPILARRPAFRALRVHMRNGFYANARFDRLVGGWAADRGPTSTSVRPAP
jgi:NAD(P)H-quinone oxidoreductase subunit 5